MCIENYDEINELTDDILDPCTYEVWALGYDEYDYVTDAELLLGTFEDPDAAVQYAAIITFADIKEIEGAEVFKHCDMLSIEVETVVDTEDGSMNVGTVFTKSIKVFYEDVRLTRDQFTLMDDGCLAISCELLKDFNKNDLVRIMFEDEKNQPVITYKIISKTTCGKYICEFIVY